VLGVVESTSDADPKPQANEVTEYFDRMLEILSMPPIYNERLVQGLVNGLRLASAGPNSRRGV